LCKPKILPLKSAVLVQLQKIEKEIEVREEGEEPDNFNVRDHK
jgi:Cilia BBSome complex subunit 10